MSNNRSSHQRCSIKNAVLKNFVLFTGKQLCWSLFLIKLQTFKRTSANGCFLNHSLANPNHTKCLSFIFKYFRRNSLQKIVAATLSSFSIFHWSIFVLQEYTNCQIFKLDLFRIVDNPSRTFEYSFSNYDMINPFVPSTPFLYPLKISENLTVFCFQGVEKGCTGNEWVKDLRNISVKYS